MFVLDTNMLSAMMSTQAVPQVAAWIAGQSADLLFTTSVSQAEILSGLAIMPEGRRRLDLETAARAMFLEDFEGRVDGVAVWPPRGDKGFGYDPLFKPDGFDRTFGQMGAEEKHGLPPQGQGLSHRARAFMKLAEACLSKRQALPDR